MDIVIRKLILIAIISVCYIIYSLIKQKFANKTTGSASDTAATSDAGSVSHTSSEDLADSDSLCR